MYFYFKKYFFDKRLIIFSFIFPILMNMTYIHLISGKYISEPNTVLGTFKSSIIRDQPTWDQA